MVKLFKYAIREKNIYIYEGQFLEKGKISDNENNFV